MNMLEICRERILHSDMSMKEKMKELEDINRMDMETDMIVNATVVEWILTLT